MTLSKQIETMQQKSDKMEKQIIVLKKNKSLIDQAFGLQCK